MYVFFFSSRRRHTRCALVTGVQTCALPIWSVVALWDIAAVSIAERQLQFPPGFARADVDLALLRERFLPYSNTSLYSDDAFRHSLFVPYSDGERARLLRSWLRLPFDHPRAYFAHRWRSEEHTSELQSLLRISYAVFCLKK